MVVPFSRCNCCIELPDPAGHVRVQADGGLVQEQELRVIEQGLGEGKLLLRPGGEFIESHPG